MATITGRLVDSRGVALAAEPFHIRPVKVKQAQGQFITALSVSGETDGSGEFSASVSNEGLYDFLFGVNDRIRFRVPNAVGTFNISNIIEKE